MSAGGAAAKQAKDEEEQMTPYSSKDLAEGWEFKILRSATNRFRDPVWTQAVLEEEARAGWTLLEKFDNARLRLKRPARARAGDGALDFDPMRTWVGMGPGRLAILIVLASLAGSAFIVLLVLLIVRAAVG
jgi:hypothetical protein